MVKRREIKIWTFYKVQGDRVIRLKRDCPKCGNGVFLADHGDRLTCGRCGYTGFKERKR